MVNTIPSTSTGRNTQQILFNVPIGQRPPLGSTRTITLTQARQMGLLAPGSRFQPLTSNSNTVQNKVYHIKYDIYLEFLNLLYISLCCLEHDGK